MARSRSHTRRAPRSNPRGTFTMRSGGCGSVRTAEGEYHIPPSGVAGAFDGDLVEIAPIRSGSETRKGGSAARAGGMRPNARVLRVVERAHDTLIGRYEVADPFGVVVPEDPRIPYDIFTMRSESPDVPDGSIVRVRIVQFPTRKSAATGVVEEVIGKEGESRIDIDLIVARHKLETAFSEGSLIEARSARLDEREALLEGYRDIRDRLVFTIDPEDARDFDDALSICRVTRELTAAEASANAMSGNAAVGSPLRHGLARAGAVWRLGVHIADVSHYVPWDSSIDLDARRRATSVYLADRVIPMIPHELSDDLCSLKPHETRRCMTVDLYLDTQADVVDYEMFPALIRSSARLTYEEAQGMLSSALPDTRDEQPSVADAYLSGDVRQWETRLSSDEIGRLAERLRTLSTIAKMRAARRAQAGGIDFSSTEAKVRLDDEGSPIAITLRRKTDATELVEEAMILANETVAAHLAKHSFPCMYRVHERPSSDALASLVPVLQEFSWFTEDMSVRLLLGQPKAIQDILAESAGRPEEELVSSLMLRSMKRAIYRVENDGHYGLASKAYAHFTSPIRRYPDLIVHRMLKAQLSRRPERFDAEVSAMPWMAEHSSEMERIADTAARESQEVKMIEYLQRFLGQSFPAVVSGVAAHGLYARLENTAEGFIPVRCLGGEYFSYDPDRYVLMGQDSGRAYRLGQRIAVTIVAANARERRLTLELARVGKGS